eukprot:gnl/MRDRNA2_/MRDRNA2_141349_c0_seq1.p1 gnl/MRDRNA2_/MRDRNA2_141349_c0~~gnl/MRDRNA2_/MRDRNA2_141349_c0_seq1.p1  ORF type:complete len:366 (+),score=43.54 gnl/MRDRNA2_/MRDRNA2_141349_c0_seq1:135-1232(+)
MPAHALSDEPPPNQSAWMKWSLMLFLGGMYITCSASLISFNKFLMHEDRFPYAVTLVMLHMGFASVLSVILFFCCPSLYPSFNDPARRVQITTRLMMTCILPITILFSAQLVLSNIAYLHSSVAFLQMMKEANLVLVYVLSLFVMLEHFKWRSVMILLFIIAATTMTIVGEVKFSYTGFAVQGASQLFECSKIVLQAVLLSEVAGGKKLDAMSYVLVVAPLCFIELFGAGWALYFIVPDHSFKGVWPHLVNWWPYLIANSCIAFALNVVIALFIKHSSAVAFILAGIVKDVIIVSVGCMMFSEHISILQGVGFTLQLVGILVWSLIKTFPDRFEDGFFVGLARTFCGYPERKAMKGKTNYGSANP